MFQVGKIYNRRADIHSAYGGQQQGGISTPSQKPFIFIFTSDAGESFGYHDHTGADDTFWYTGEGQTGDMQMDKGNLAIRDHEENGKKIYLFEYVKKAHVKFVGECNCVDLHTEERPDKYGDLRRAYIFHLEIEDGQSYEAKPEVIRIISPKELKKKTVGELRDIARRKAPKASERTIRKAYVSQRAQAIKLYALARANGCCEGCNNPAPFKAKKGPYLEVHHMKRVADGGADLPENVVALCPNCHRRTHYSLDGNEFNAGLIEVIRKTEQCNQI